MTALEILVKLIRDSEGCKLKAYEDCVGVVTIGYGQTKGIKEGMVWTQAQADEDLLKTACSVLNQALTSSPILKTATTQRQAAIADFIYNLGIGNYNSSTLKKYVDKENWASAYTEIKKWNKAGGKVLKGLTIRREREASLLIA
jgi:lysozyme